MTRNLADPLPRAETRRYALAEYNRQSRQYIVLAYAWVYFLFPVVLIGGSPASIRKGERLKIHRDAKKVVGRPQQYWGAFLRCPSCWNLHTPNSLVAKAYLPAATTPLFAD